MTHDGIIDALQPLAVAVELLDELLGNPRRGDVAAIVRSYRQFGQRKPIVARKSADGRGVVIAGNHQLKAARELGWSHIAVVWVDDDDATAAAFALADNRTAELGDYDEEALAALIADVNDEALLLATGWTEAEIAKLLPDFEPVDDIGSQLDSVSPTVCPSCGFAWRKGPNGEPIEMQAHD